MQQQHWKVSLEEHVLGDAAKHELTEPVAAVGAHDDEVGAEIPGRTLNFRCSISGARAHALDFHVQSSTWNSTASAKACTSVLGKVGERARGALGMPMLSTLV